MWERPIIGCVNLREFRYGLPTLLRLTACGDTRHLVIKSKCGWVMFLGMDRFKEICRTSKSFTDSKLSKVVYVHVTELKEDMERVLNRIALGYEHVVLMRYQKPVAVLVEAIQFAEIYRNSSYSNG